MLDIVASYYFIQFQGELMTQTQENDKKTLILGLIYARCYQIRAVKVLF